MKFSLNGHIWSLDRSVAEVCDKGFTEYYSHGYSMTKLMMVSISRKYWHINSLTSDKLQEKIYHVGCVMDYFINYILQ